ncbi:MAG: ATPase, T2SS/T4P/T4SS family [Phycisphaerae bacterium]
MYSTYQVADLLGTTPAHVAEWMRKGWLPFIRLPDGPVRVSHQVLRHFLQQRGVDVEYVMEHADLTDGEYEGDLSSLQPTSGDDEDLSAYLQEPPRQQDTHPAENAFATTRDGDHAPGLTALHERPARPAPDEQPPVEPSQPNTETRQPEPPQTEADANGHADEPAADEGELHDNEDTPPGEREIDHRLEAAILRKIAEAESQPTHDQTEADSTEPADQEQPPEPHRPQEPQEGDTDGLRHLPPVFEPRSDDQEPGADAPFEPELHITRPAQAAGQLLTALLQDAASRGATHLHIERSGESLRMHWRLDGVLRENTGFRDHLPGELAEPLLEEIRLRAGIGRAQPIVPRQGRFEVDFEGRTLRCEAMEFRTLAGVKFVLRLADPHRPPPRLGTLGMGSNERSSLESLLSSPAGLILVAAPPGHDTLATLHASAMNLAHRGRGVLALEGEDALLLPGVTQVAVGPTSGLTESVAMRAAASADADAIVLPGVRDLATANLATHAALSGQVVVAGITACSGPDAVRLLLDAGVSPWSLSGALRGVVAQRTVRRLCLFCRQQTPPTPQAIAPLGRLARQVDFPVFLPNGCEECSRTGYRDTTGVFTVLRVDRTLQGLIRRSADTETLCRGSGQTTDLPHLLVDGLRVLRDGFTSPAELANRLRDCIPE